MMDPQKVENGQIAINNFNGLQQKKCKNRTFYRIIRH